MLALFPFSTQISRILRLSASLRFLGRFGYRGLAYRGLAYRGLAYRGLALLVTCLALLSSGCSGFDGTQSDSDDERLGQTSQAAAVALGDGWFGTNLGGSEALAGTSSLDAGVFTVSGGGGDLWGLQDDGHFVYQPISGDFDFVVRVSGYSGDTSPTYAKAAIVFKEATTGSEPTSQAAGVYQSLNFGTEDYWYVRDGGGYISAYNSFSINAYGQGDWMRMTRIGNIFRSYHFDAGSASWIQHGGDRVVALNSQGYLGMAATSSGTTLMTATFTDVSLGGPAPDNTAPVISNINVVGSGTSATISWDTDEPATSSVDYGTTAAYGSNQNVGGSAAQHQITLTGLTESTQYHFSITSDDASSNSSSTADATFDSGTIPATALPAGWLGINLGDSEAAGGSSSHTNGVFTVTGGGGDLWSFQDDAHLVYQAVEGDFELIATIDGYSGDTSYAYAKGALLFKEDGGSGIPGVQAGTVYQSLNYAGDDYWYVRDSGAGSISAYNATSLNSTGGSARLRLTRTGDVFRSYSWDSGSQSWIQHGGDRTVALNSNGFVGLAATSGSGAGLLSVQFSDVSIVGGSAGPDTIPPTISNVAVTQTDTSASISWTTNEPASSVVDYGLTAGFGSQHSDGTLVTAHSVLLTGLTASTLYHFQVQSADGEANNTVGPALTFTTASEPDVIPPVISNVAVAVTDTTATITWDTDEPASSVVDHGLSVSYGSQPSDGTLVTAHSVLLTGLAPSTLHHFMVSSADAFANPASDIDRTFTTDAVPPPAVLISNVTVSNISEHSADISWTTDIPATSVVDYDLNLYPKNVSDLTLTTSHAVTVGRMMAGEDHDYVITADDGSGGVASTSLQTLSTVAYAGDSLPAGWGSIDIGPVSTELPGSATFDPLASGGTFVVRGTGTDVFNSQDSFHFVYHPVAGDFQLTLRVDGWHGYLHQWSKAMTMFRVDFDDDSEMFNQSLNNTGNDWLYYRTPKGTAHVEITNGQLNPGDGTAVWARLTRVGNTFTEEYSSDGVTWQYHGPAGGTVVALPAAGYVGFGVCSKSNEYLSEIVYSNVNLVDNSTPDVTAPAIANVTVTPAGESASISWTTDESATSYVDYGLTSAYGSSETVAGLAVNHQVLLTGLTPNTTYHFSVTSADLFSNSSSSSDITFDSGDLPSGALPPEWSSIDLGGSVAMGGSALYNAGVFSVSGGGGDLWGNQDDAHFVYQPVNGDFDLTVQVDAYAGDTSYTYSKAALMFKEDSGGGVPSATAPGIYQSLNYSSEDYWYERGAFSITNYNSAVLNSTGGSALLRLTRTGDIFRSYTSSNGGASWVQHGGDRTVALNTSGYIGFAATSGTTGGLLTVDFSNVSLGGGSPPTPDTTAPVVSNIAVQANGNGATISWTTDEPASSVVDYGLDANYGSQASTAGLTTSHQVALSGLTPATIYHFSVVSADSSANESTSADDTFDSGQLPSNSLPAGWFNVDLDASVVGGAIFTSNEFVVSGGGADFWNNADGGHMVYQPVDGDFELQATIVSYAGDTSQAYSKAMLLFKAAAGSETAPTASAAGVFQSINYGAEDYWYQRDTAGASVSSFSSSTLNSTGGTVRVSLTRTGNIFRSYQWDGANWIQIGSDRVVAVNTVGFVGMGVTSNTSQLMDVTFGDVSLVKEPADNVFVYAGTMDQTGGAVLPGEVIRYKVDRSNGSLFYMDSVPAGGGVRWAAFSPDSQYMYVLVEDGVSGYLRSFSIAADGSLTDLNTQVALGAVHTQVTLDATGAYAFTAGFDTGEMVMVPLDGLGGFGTPQTFSPGAGAHQVAIHANNNFLYVPTLGLERVAQYNVDVSGGLLTANTPATVSSIGAPRYMDFHPSLDRAYVVHETGIVRTFSLDPSSGNLTYLSSVTTTDEPFSNCSDFQVSASGQYAYAMNRSAGGMGVYSIDGLGDLTRIQNVDVGGTSSRSFAIDEAGDYLFVGHRQTKNIVTLSRDPGTGQLTTGGETTTPDNIWYVGFLELP